MAGISDPGYNSGYRHLRLFPPRMRPFEQMIAHAQCVCHDGERRIHCTTRAEEACVDDIQVVELMRFTITI